MDQAAWIAAAEPQLLPLVPKKLWARLHEKLTRGIFDAGTVLGFAALPCTGADDDSAEVGVGADAGEPQLDSTPVQLEEEFAASQAETERNARMSRLREDTAASSSTAKLSEDAADSSSADTTPEPDTSTLTLVAARELEPAEDIFLCDHAWSFDGPGMARAQLAEHPQLRARIGAMLLGRCGEGIADVPAGDERQRHDDVDWLMHGLWGLTGSYSINGGNADAMVVHYVLDEIGSSFAPAPSPERPDAGMAAFLMIPFINPEDSVAYSIFFPRRRVCEWERATCAGLPHATSRAAALARVLHPKPDRMPKTVSDAVQTFRGALSSAGFDCKTVCQLLRVDQLTPSTSHTLDDAGSFAYTYLPAWDLGPGSAANASATAWLDKLEKEQAHPPVRLLDLVRLFVLGQSMADVDRVAAAVGGMAVLRAIASLGILWQPAGSPCSRGDSDDCQAVRRGSPWASAVQLVPVPLGMTTDAKSFYVATDWPNASATLRFGGEQEEPVMYVGPDTLGLVAAMVATDGPLTSCAASSASPGGTESCTAVEVLDLCCGCGVQSLAIAMCRQVRGVGETALTMIDRSPRAVRFARFNILLNGIAEGDTAASAPRAAVYCGDASNVASVLPQRMPRCSFDAILINPPYIPNPEKAAGLETFGDGGWSGEELTAAAVSQSKSLLRCGGILAVVANLPNADGYPAKLQQWWETEALHEGGYGQDENAADAQSRGLEATVLCGCKWTPQRYAELIHMYDSSTATTTDNYARALERSGVEDVCNGFLFARIARALAGDRVSCTVSTSHEQIWQAVAGVCGHKVATQIQGAASDACRAGAGLSR